MDAHTLDRISGLSRRYARYTQSQPGLGLLLGGALALLAMAILPGLATFQAGFVSSPWAKDKAWQLFEIAQEAQCQGALRALVVAIFPFLWVFTKETVRAHFVARLGEVTEQHGWRWNLARRILATLLGGVAFLCPIWFLLILKGYFFLTVSSVQVVLGLALVGLLPWATLRFIRGPQEAVLWGLGMLLVLAEVWGAGYVWGVGTGIEAWTSLSAWGAVQNSMLPWLSRLLWVASLAALLIGMIQHLGFLRVLRELRKQEAARG